jgi:hypothetical protein
MTADNLPITLSAEELHQLERWYLAHYLAEENSRADDELRGKLIAHRALSRRAA